MTSHKTIAYLRVSTDVQDVEKNKADILRLANEKDLGKVQWIEETGSGKVSWRKRKIVKIIDEAEMGKKASAEETHQTIRRKACSQYRAAM